MAHPDQVRGLVLMEPPLPSAIPAMERTPLHTMQIEGLTPLLRAGQLRETIIEFWGTFFPDQSPEQRREVADAALATNRSGWESFAKEHPVVAVWSPTPAEWSRITQPALVLAGGSTVGWFQELAAKVAELLPRGELGMLEGLGHGAPVRVAVPVDPASHGNGTLSSCLSYWAAHSRW
jgi:pimeloyl-ACP methyl ester carboxylesterase